MNWILIALIAPFLWAIGNIVTKIVRAKHIKSPIAYLTIAITVSSLLLLGILIKPIDFRFEFIYIAAILLGVFTTFQFYLYVDALEYEDVSTLIPFFSFDPVMVLLISTVFLGEILSVNHYIAFLFLFIGGVLMSIKKKRFHISKGVRLVLLSGFLYSIYAVIIKYLSGFIDSWSIYMLVRIGILISAIFLFMIKKVRVDVVKAWKGLNNKTRWIISFVEIIGAFGILSTIYAIDLASASLVTAMMGFQPLFVLVIAVVLSFKFSHIFKEELNKKIILQKLVAICLMIIGLMFL